MMISSIRWDCKSAFQNRYNIIRFVRSTARHLSSSSYDDSSSKDAAGDNAHVSLHKHHQRVWKASDSSKKGHDRVPLYWNQRVIDQEENGGKGRIDRLVNRINERENQGGRMRQSQLGVLHQDPATDMQMLIDNYTVKAVASALRDREDALQQAAIMAADGRMEELRAFLQIFHPKYVLERRQLQKRSGSSTTETVVGGDDTTATAGGGVDPITDLHTDACRQVLRKALMRMPRTVTTAHSKRAGVCLALCLSNGVPSILLEKRSKHLRAHPDEVCLPGGMVCDFQDQTIVSTSIREMKEEIGGLDDGGSDGSSIIEVLGVLRLNWGEVQHLTGVAVTPVVCYLGELPDDLSPNPDEVSEVFTIPLSVLLDKSLWVHKEGLAPIFVGGPYMIWGLTGYILECFGRDVLRPLVREKSDTTITASSSGTIA